MSKQQCAKEILCSTAEASYAASAYGEFVKPEELDRLEKVCANLQELRLKLADRADAAR